MSEVFLKVLNMSIAAGWLILAVLLLRLALRRAPKWIFVALWGIVALRLAVPFSFESALSLIPSAETFAPRSIPHGAPAVSSGIPAANNAVDPIPGGTFAPDPVGSVDPLYDWIFVVSMIWLIGIAAMLLYAVISYARVHRSVAERAPYEENIFLCDHVQSPFILGLVRPRIYLPSDMDEAAMGPVIAHEKAHLARCDHWWKPMGFLILAVHWFDPLCWIAYVLLCRDIELACDEKVIRQMDLDEKKRYSTALLECSTGRRLVTICPLAFGEVGVKERVKNVLNYKKPAFWVIAAAIVACAVVTVGFATNPVKKQPPVNDLQLISADVMDLRSDPPILYSMNASELDELSSRLKDINMTGVDDDLMGMTPYYSITITDQKVERFSVSGFDTDGSHVGILYQGHYYRVQDDAFSRYLQNICAGHQRADALPRLTLDDVVTLSKKGSALTWSDFEPYQGQDIGSGLYIMRYEIDELFDVLVGGVPDETPMYIHLRNHNINAWVDLREDSVERVKAFIEVYKNDTPSFAEPKPDGSGEPAPEEPDVSVPSDEQAAIRQAILGHNRSAEPTGLICSASFVQLAAVSGTPPEGSSTHKVTYYGWALYNEYTVTDDGVKEVRGNHIPVAISFDVDERGYTLTEYWEPRDGSYFARDIREKFPADIAEDGLDSQKFIAQQEQECYDRAEALLAGLLAGQN